MRWIWIDRFVAFESGKSATAVKNLSLAEDHFADHFPGYPVMPGVLIVEALAQAGAVLVLTDPAAKDKIPYFARIDNCRFRQQVRPGDTLRLQMEMTSFRPPVGKGRATAFVDDTLVCEADLTFALAPKP